MTFQELKQNLQLVDYARFEFPGGTTVAPHYHLTEVAVGSRTHMDCGGEMRRTTEITLQLHVASDVDHRLSSDKFHSILVQAESSLSLTDAEVFVEVQEGSISKYALDFPGDGSFRALPLKTVCLAPEKCGIPLQTVSVSSNSCTPGSGCC